MRLEKIDNGMTQLVQHTFQQQISTSYMSSGVEERLEKIQNGVTPTNTQARPQPTARLQILRHAWKILST